MVVAAIKQTGARAYLWVPIACNRPVWTEEKWTGWDLNPEHQPGAGQSSLEGASIRGWVHACPRQRGQPSIDEQLTLGEVVLQPRPPGRYGMASAEMETVR